MTRQEYDALSNKIFKGIEMISQKSEEIGRAKQKYTIEELGMLSDINKDCGETLMYLAKANYYLSEHSAESF